jgi:uncharacterized membrane protein YebE (DUF533 family)
MSNEILPVAEKGTALERWFIEHATALLNPRMLAWLVLTVLMGGLLWYVGRAAQIGSLAVTVFNASALGYLGYRVANALERGKRPHEIWEEADAARQSNDPERGWQLEQLADSMQRRRTIIVAACIVAAVIMKF